MGTKVTQLPASTGLAANDLFYTVDDPSGVPIATKATVQQAFNAVGALAAGSTVQVADILALAQSAVAKKFTVQQLLNAINQLPASGSLGITDTVAIGIGGVARGSTIQQVLNAVDSLSAAGALAGTDTLEVIQAAVAKEATVTQLVTFLQSSLASLDGSAYRIIGGSTSATTNGTALTAAYAFAKTATPHGAALSVTNRFTILLLPGTYDMGAGALTMDTQFIDIVGMDRLISGSPISSSSGGWPGGCRIVSSGTAISKTASDARLISLTISTTANNVNTPAYSASAAFSNELFAFVYFVGENAGGGQRGMVRGKPFAGYYFYCHCTTADGFGSTAGGDATGTFIGCKSGTDSFGSGATASGLFIECQGSGGSFAGGGGTASGTFILCRQNQDYGSSASPLFGQPASGTFLYCETTGQGFGGADASATGTFVCCRAGDNSFGCGGGTGGLVASGTFLFCKGGNNSFGGAVSGNPGMTVAGIFRFCVAGTGSFAGRTGTASGTFWNCIASDDSWAHCTAPATFYNCVGGNNCFGTGGGQALGTFVNCIAGTNSFGGGTGILASGNFYNCVGSDNCFAGAAVTGGTASGVFVNCVGGTNCFGSGGTTAGTMSGLMLNCRMTGHMRINLTGKIENMRIEATVANTTALQIASTSTGAVYNCTLIGTGTGVSLAEISGTPTIKVAHCRFNKGMSVNITNSIGTPYNVDDTDIA